MVHKKLVIAVDAVFVSQVRCHVIIVCDSGFVTVEGCVGVLSNRV